MGRYSQLIDDNLTPEALLEGRKSLLARIESLRKRPLIALTSHPQSRSLAKGRRLFFEREDIFSIEDQLEDFEGEDLDVWLDIPWFPPSDIELLRRILGRTEAKLHLIFPYFLPASLLTLAEDATSVTALEDARYQFPRAPQADPTPGGNQPTFEIRFVETLEKLLPDGMGPTLEVVPRKSELGRVFQDLLFHYQLSYRGALQKIFETSHSQIYRQGVPHGNGVPIRLKMPGSEKQPSPQESMVAIVEVQCECGTSSKIQANLDNASPLKDGHWAFPADDQFHCPECMSKKDLTSTREQIEKSSKKKIVR